MKVIKKYTAIQVRTRTVDETVELRLSYGEIEGTYYCRTSPEEEFDTEEEAIEYAYNRYKSNIWGKWIILPVIRFDSFEEDRLTL